MSSQILLIEDDIDLLESYEDSLKISGYCVLTASNAKDGIELYQSHNPCIVFSDIKMSGMDGYEFFSNIREFDPIAKVILVTAHENKEKTKIAIKNGLLDVLTKPLKTYQLQDTIGKNGC